MTTLAIFMSTFVAAYLHLGKQPAAADTVPRAMRQAETFEPAPLPIVKKKAALSPPPKRVERAAVKTRKTWALVRAYTPFDAIDRNSPFRDGKTSTMKDTRTFPHHWGVAADPRAVPYGTKIYVPGYDPSGHFPERTFWPVDDTGAITRRAYRSGIRVKGRWYPAGTSCWRCGSSTSGRPETGGPSGCR